MHTRLFTWPRLILATALAILAGAGVWLSVAGPGTPASPAAPGQAPSPAPAGVLPTLNMRELPATAPAPRPASCASPSLAGASGAWLPDYFDDPDQPGLIAEQATRLRLLDFAWLQLGSTPDSIMQRAGNPGASSLATVLGTAAAANPCGWRFVTVSDEQTPKSVMAQILLDPQARWRDVVALATVMAGYPQADGLTLDYEFALPSSQQDLDLYASVAHWRGLTVGEEVGGITAGYTEFVRELALAMQRQHRALRVAVMVRTTDEIDYSDPSSLTPFLYDYGELAKYAGQIVLMAVDFHWSTGDPGPIVTMSDLTSVLNDVRTYHIPVGRIAVESPMYGYDWTVDRAGHRLASVQAAMITATDLAARTWVKTGSKDGETSYTYTANGQRHVVWFGGTGMGYQAAQLRRMYPGCAVVAWATGNTDPAGSALILQALGS